jgi:hypothetical protein
MSQLTDRLERDLREIAAGAHPSPSAWESIVARLGDDAESEVALVLAPAPDRSKHPVWIAVAAASLVVITGSIAVLVTRAGDDHSISTADPDATTNPSVVPPSTVTDVVPTIPPTAAPFVGIWVSTDSHSSYLEIIGSGGDDYEFSRRDFATACSGAPATMTGIGLLETDERLVIAQPELTCDDGTIPGIGPPPQAELANFTLDLDTATDELVDSLGVVWQRDLPNLTTTFVSPRNGFSINHPDTVGLIPANDLWDPFNVFITERGVDVLETRFAVFKGASTELTDGISIDEYLDDNVFPDGCGAPRSQQAEITIDGLSGRISECPNKIEATVVAGGRLYLFTLLHDRSDARAVFDAFAATIDLTPETAVDFPNLTATFVSPTYGYSFGYKRGLAPATELWDPGDEQLDNIQIDDRFDAVETALAAYFGGASTAIPDGVAIDAWYDENVSPSGCGVPRSQQPEITIDGQSGRIAECPNLIEATVVAGGRLYLFMLAHERSDARAFFDAWVATIDLTPETAAVP